MSPAAIAAARRAIERAARDAVPTLADFCLVHLVAGRVIRCVAGAHSTREGGRDVRALMSHRIRPDDRDSTVAQVVRTHRATLRREIYPDTHDRARARGLAELHRRLAPTSALVVPIVIDGAVLGALSLCYSHSGRSYAARHVASAERLASRIADILVAGTPIDAPIGLRAAVRHAGQGTTVRRRVAARNQSRALPLISRQTRGPHGARLRRGVESP
jgi:GAF domain-containing protein